jgi:hypothetical protein
MKEQYNNEDNLQEELSQQYFGEDYKSLSKFEKDEINHLIKVQYT